MILSAYPLSLLRIAFSSHQHTHKEELPYINRRRGREGEPGGAIQIATVPPLSLSLLSLSLSLADLEWPFKADRSGDFASQTRE